MNDKINSVKEFKFTNTILILVFPISIMAMFWVLFIKISIYKP